MMRFYSMSDDDKMTVNVITTCYNSSYVIVVDNKTASCHHYFGYCHINGVIELDIQSAMS